ncbi:pentaheme c-type cytochrome TorC [Citrobacter sp. A316]|uniref:pentaheme c-type cytochrome TorC n=1 Tax=Citrobacter sp. A316 TaxID=1639132 RepID=UPI0009ABEB18|nr:pentaheme c-type cytochrome TorC [Citrobacter sp. A316]OPW93302.1 trimethylamine N-oxide reductase cytochrome c-type subunit [Citrobacter sp. A316]
MSLIRKKILLVFISGAVAMLALLWGGWQGIHYTSTTEFCLSCHSMATVGQEYQRSTHFKNASGVRAECRDCHIPPGIFPTLIRKGEALNDFYHEFISPSIDTPEAFKNKRAELAQREWKRMSENNSAACKSCHTYTAMDHSKQSVTAATQMTPAAVKDSNCIDCHKGIAHDKPDMSSGFRSQYKNLVQQSNSLPDSSVLYTLTEKPLMASVETTVGKAIIMPATEVIVLNKKENKVLIKVTGWRESSGRGRVIAQYPGKRVFSAVLDETLTPLVKIIKTQIEPTSHQEWQQVSFEAWTTVDGFTDSIEPIWQYAAQMYEATCSGCHSAPPTTRYNANGWIAGLKSMSIYYRLQKQEEYTLLKYLQNSASDTKNNH